MNCREGSATLLYIDKMKKNYIYFPNLNGLRFFAALAVIILHIEQFKSFYHIKNFYHIVFIQLAGKLGVVFFFVLSGFLITYLLLKEEEVVGEINMKQFYIRRLLRIWPLYYLLVFLSLFILPKVSVFIVPGFENDVVFSNIFTKIILYIIFLPNLVLSWFGIIPYVSQTWSVGTEEQFYLLWPIILKKFRRHRLFFIFSVIIIYLLIKIYFDAQVTPNRSFWNVASLFWASFNIDCMAIGGIYAIILYRNNYFLKYLTNSNIFYFVLFTIVFLTLKGVKFPILNLQIYSFLFGALILNFAVNDHIKLSLENKYLNYLGKISFGLYMYHPIAIIAAIRASFYLGMETNFIYYPLSIIITIFLAHISYNYFEKYFLKFKEKFTFIRAKI